MADTRVPVEPPHDCPGGCGREVPHHKVACFQCWGLLPAPLRVAVTRSRGGNRLAAVGDAARWLRENVAEGVRINQPKFRITFADGGAPR